MIIVSRKNGMQMNPVQWIQSHMDSVDTVPHGLDPLATQDPKYDHEGVKEVAEVPPQLTSVEVLRDVVGSEQLHSHHGKDEDDNGQHETEVTESAHCSTDDANEEVQSRPRLGEFEHTQLSNTFTSSSPV